MSPTSNPFEKESGRPSKRRSSGRREEKKKLVRTALFAGVGVAVVLGAGAFLIVRGMNGPSGASAPTASLAPLP